MQSSSPNLEVKRREPTKARLAKPDSGQSVGLRVVNDAVSKRDLVLVADLAEKFLEWQCRMIAGVMRGSIFLPRSDGTLGSLCARWPHSGETAEVLSVMASKALKSGESELSSQIHYTDNKGQVCDAIACPIMHNGRIVAVISVALATRALPQQKAVQQLLEWGVNWFGTLLNREARSIKQRAPVLLELVQQSIGKESLLDLAESAVQLLAERTDCERASIAISNGGKLRLLAVSGLDEFDRRARFSTRLEDAMEEAGDQETPIHFPAISSNSTTIDRAHQRLADANPNNRFYTLVSTHDTMRVGVLLEGERNTEFDSEQIDLFNDACALLAQSAALIHAANGSISSMVNRGRRGVEKRARGRAGFWALIFAVLIGISALIPSTQRVTADAELNSHEQRAVVASIAGYIESAHVRPGDDVKEGDLLASLDTRDLKLEASKWHGLRGARQAEYQDALANRDRTQISVLRARLEQIDAEMALIDAQLSRAQLRAPYAGVIVSGDLSQALDAPVELGQVLFEIAPLTGYRVVIEVNEFDITSIAAGLEGQLRLASMPHKQLPFVVERIIPVAVSGDGHSYFRVEALLTEVPPEVRPGMRGVAKITAAEKSLLWVWTHTVIDRMRLFIWSLGF